MRSTDIDLSQYKTDKVNNHYLIQYNPVLLEYLEKKYYIAGTRHP
jgi:hypothetical protein